jgi:4'-phosphopantetheinyl transferase
MTDIYTTGYTLEEGAHKYRKEHQIGLTLLGQALQQSRNITLSEEEIAARYTYGKHGKPYLRGYEELHFNISHCDGWVACVLADVPVGIDVERVGAVPPRVIPKILTEQERAYLSRYQGQERKYADVFYRFWTLKESYLKWCGDGFYSDPRQVEFFFEEGTAKIRCSNPKVTCYQMHPDGDCVLSVCYG